MDLSVKKRNIGFSYAWSGIKQAFQEERNFRIHLVSAILVIMTAGMLRFQVLEWAILILVIGQVLVAELINSAIERMVDYFKPDYHPAAGFIKDVAAGAVLVAAIIAIMVGSFLFLPKLYDTFM
nr:diacylglycerol kinase family protein [Oceanobacillus piezotolerans]